MAAKDEIQKMLYSLDEDYSLNCEKIYACFKTLELNYGNALFILTNEVYEEKSCLLAINSLLLSNELDPNLRDRFKDTFIFNAIKKGYSLEFVQELINKCLTDENIKNKININDCDRVDATFLNAALYSKECKGDIAKFYKFLLDNGFDSSAKDYFGRNAFFAFVQSKAKGKKYPIDQEKEFKCLFNNWIINGYKEIDDVPVCKDVISFEEDMNQFVREIGSNKSKNVVFMKDLSEYFGLTMKELCESIFKSYYDENRVLNFIRTALSENYELGLFVENRKNNLIQQAIETGYSEYFVLSLSDMLLSYKNGDKKVNVNHVNSDGWTVLHSAIYSGKYEGDISAFYKLLLEEGFDSSIRDKDNRNIVDAMIYMKDKYKTYSDDEILRVVEIFDEGYAHKVDKKIIVNKEYTESVKELIGKVLDKMVSDNAKENIEIIKEICLKRKDWNYNDLFYCLTVNKYDEEKCFRAIMALLDNGVNPNYTVLNGQNNFIQNAINNGYSEEFISSILSASLLPFDSKSMNINYVSYGGDTILHSAIKSDKYDGSILSLYKILVDLGFDSSALDKEGRNIMEVVANEQGRSGKFSVEEIENIRKIYNQEVDRLGAKTAYERIAKERDFYNSSSDEKVEIDIKKKKEEKKGLSSWQLDELEEFGVVLNNKNYISEPVIGREREMEDLMVSLAQDKKSPIIVGESGVGKSALVDELAYLIKNDKVPSFLKNKIVYEVSPGDLVAGCSYVGQFEAKLKKLFEVAKKYEVILFIDEIHTMYGVGTSDKKSTGMQDYVKHFIDRNNGVKFIGTTTEAEYQQFMSGDALKRRFEKIKVCEPDDKTLYRIFNKVIDDYCLKSNLSFNDENEKEEIVRVLMQATSKSHRVYDDRVNNPDLGISIIDKAFAFAKYFDDDSIGKKEFIKSFEYCDRIYDSASEWAISKLKNKPENDPSKEKKAKILEVDFTKFRR